MSVTASFFDWPDRWQTRPLFSTGSEVSRRNTGMREENLLSLSYGRVVQRDIDSVDGLLPESFETYQIVEPGDEVFRFTDLQNDQRSLRSGLVTERGIITSAYLAFRPNQKYFDPRYFDYLMRMFDNGKVFYSLGGGVRQSLKFADVRRLSVPMPPLDEQKAIANYLDRECAEVAAVSSNLQSLAKMLTEMHSSFVEARLLGGASLGAPASPRRTAVFESVSAGWSVVPLKALLARNDGGAWGDEPDGSDHEVVVLRSTEQTQSGHWSMSDPALRKLTRRQWDETRLEEGDLLVTKSSGSEAHIGKVTLVDSTIADLRASFSNFMQRLRLKEGVSPKFIWWYLNSRLAKEQLRVMSTSTTGLGNLNATTLGNVAVLLPDIRHQLTITAELDEFGGLLLRTQQAIDVASGMLEARRQSLIAAAVTGKIDVKGESRG